MYGILNFIISLSLSAFSVLHGRLKTDLLCEEDSDRENSLCNDDAYACVRCVRLLLFAISACGGLTVKLALSRCVPDNDQTHAYVTQS